MGFKSFSNKFFKKTDPHPPEAALGGGLFPPGAPPPSEPKEVPREADPDASPDSGSTRPEKAAARPASGGHPTLPPVSEPQTPETETVPQPGPEPCPAPLAVVLLSGGMDSLAAAGVARKDGFELALIHYNYGQRTEEAELRAFRKIADILGVASQRRLVVHTNLFSLAGGSALTDPSVAIPPADLSRKDIPATYVPFRNAVLLSMAITWAEALGATAVYYGAVSADSSGYPDCSPSFVNAFNQLVSAGTKAGPELVVRAPLVDLTKAQIVRLASEMGLPLERTWSCYTRNDRACGACDSCALRRRGFEMSGIPDPTPYAPTPEQIAQDRQRKLDAARRLARLMNALTRSPAQEGLQAPAGGGHPTEARQ